jgi:hypothetical protein
MDHGVATLKRFLEEESICRSGVPKFALKNQWWRKSNKV